MISTLGGSHLCPISLSSNDGFHIGYSSFSNCGGLIRDFKGCYVNKFNSNMSCSILVMTELWSLNHRLQLNSNMGFNYLIVVIDSLIVVGMIDTTRNSHNLPLLTLLHEALSLIDKEG